MDEKLRAAIKEVLAEMHVMPRSKLKAELNSHLRQSIGMNEVKETLSLRAKEMGMANLERACGIPRTHLYTIFSSRGNPSLDSLCKIVSALGLRIEIK